MIQNNKSPDVIFITGATSKIGFGHIYRSLSLAKGFRQQNFLPSFILKPWSKSAAFLIRKENFCLQPQQQINKNAITIIDGYHIPTKFDQKIMKDRFVVRIDDLVTKDRHYSQVIINPQIYASPNEYINRTRSSAAILSGPKFSLLDPAFSNALASPPRRLNRSNPFKLVATFGGTDEAHLSLRLLKALKPLKFSWRLKLILGHSSRYYQEQVKRQAAANDRIEIITVLSPQRFAETLAESDLAIIAAGTTCYQTIAVGTPTIAIAVGNDQEHIAQTLANYQALEYLGHEKKLTSKLITNAINTIAKNINRRKILQRKGRQLIDGKGIYRATKEIIRLYNYWKHDPILPSRH